MYTTNNFKTKKAMKDAVKRGDRVEVYQPGGMFPAARDGVVAIEGPHYPEPHRWYSSVEIAEGHIVRVKS